MFKKALICALAAASVNVYAATDTEVNAIDNIYSNMRSRGMGGAITAAADDYAAIFFNPAMLADYEESRVNMGFGLGYTPAITNFMSDVSNAQNEPNEAQRTLDLVGILEDYNGEAFYGNPYFNGTWASKNHSFSLMPVNAQVDLMAYYCDTCSTDLERANQSGLRMNARTDFLMAYAYARKIKKNFNVGVTVKGLYRVSAEVNLKPADISDDNFFDNNEEAAGGLVDFDIGMYYKTEKPWWKAQPAFSAVIRNVIDAGFTIGTNDTPPSKLERRLDLGSDFKFPRFWTFQPRFTFDIRNIGHSEWNITKGTHIGVELDWEASSWLDGAYRLGVNQGYITAGIEAQFAWFRLDIATWGEASGTGDDTVESRRTAINMSLDF